jgi:hypothetical protein
VGWLGEQQIGSTNGGFHSGLARVGRSGSAGDAIRSPRDVLVTGRMLAGVGVHGGKVLVCDHQHLRCECAGGATWCCAWF